MELIGEKLIPAPISATWEALNDAEVLKSCIAGCESLDQVQANMLAAQVALKIGPVKARFKGTLTLSDMNPPHSYVVSFEGQGGIAGFGKGAADVSLTEQGDQTLLRYAARAQVGGRLAQVGSRLIDAAAAKIAEDFFAAFEVQLQPASVEAAANQPAFLGKAGVRATSRLTDAAAPKVIAHAMPAAGMRLPPLSVAAAVDQPNVFVKTGEPAKPRPAVAATPIQLVGERVLPAPIFATFNAINNADVLKSCIFGCESLEHLRADTLMAVLALGIGPVGARFKSTIQLSDMLIPSSYVLSFEGEGGTKGWANISLIEDGRQTRVRYSLQAQVRGPLAKAGPRLIEAVSAQVAKSFFSAFEARLLQPTADMAASRSSVPAKTGTPVKGWLWVLLAAGAAAAYTMWR
ncbi:CoxG family protein [Rugamonas apoptosis]|uniref:Carbon monoxide dehydrogenase subunit G n=1 Tax=Rugamonas apoptosis TaxID=2758570 RepID=A0A7W2FBZ3_9BURK|nr:carbon monoxide dehydrogenase subunit G [Rugamonas apoptosis]MBA5688915.1 carbon monoxide dehydrogenase subunit G [Rugamonas apoptosis]